MVDATSSNAYAQQLKERELDPNVLQRIAADPDVNVWVNASAGTGKTKVLTDRVLRLLLPRHDGRMGAHPAKILCITFTKAGASEMILRVQDTLARWTSIEDGDEETKGSLRFELRQLFGRKPTKMQVSSAKSLFRQIIDMPNGMNIMTIHSFCQSILARFPLEASISPNMNMIDEAQSKILLDEARLSVMRQSYKERSSDLARCVYNLARTVNSDQFMDLLVGMLKERDQLFSILERYPSFEHIHYDLCGLYKIDPQLDEQSSIRQSVSEYAIDREGLKNAALKMLGSKSKKDNERGAIIESFLSAVSEEERAEQFYRYLRAFLSTKYEPYANIATKTLCKVHEEIFDVLANECDRLIVVLNDLKAIKNARHSVDLMQCGHAFIQAYMQLKHERAMLDFDDQILKTLDLLRTSAAWVLYKLDQGIEHILLDEAQDTNPEQWQIVEALYQEFYTQEVNAGDNPRTVFVVGDEKQSIYGFQRASPEKFSEMRSKLKGLVHTMGQAYEDVGLNISFRTTPPVLKAVDLTFGPDFMRKGVSHDPVEHTSFRRGQAGLVEMWPLCEPQDNEDLDLWSGFKKPLDEQEGDAMLAQQIADKIAYWIDHKEILETHARPIQAGDIMILVRSRTRFVHQLIRALKSKMIPVSGADR